MPLEETTFHTLHCINRWSEWVQGHNFGDKYIPQVVTEVAMYLLPHMWVPKRLYASKK